ncbi:MAG TPA: heavy metal-responsive transcriptional regulator [Vicinamibacterales bacterium]|jgi:DNA-binding transcriptional MerR regulator
MYAMRIGELAGRAGVNVQTILYYERRRLLPPAPRTSSGYRSYSDTDLAQLQFIRQTKQLGFTLKEIAALLPIHGSPRHPKGLVHRTPSDDMALFRMVTERLSHIEAQIATLQRIREALRAAIDQSQSRLTVCPASGQTPRHRKA